MEAKDTVITPEYTREQRKKLFPHGHKDCMECEKFIREAQAEIAFTAGYEEGRKVCPTNEVQGTIYCEGKQDGIRKVVGWIERNLKQFQGFQYLDEDKWQQQLKEWDIT